MKLIDVVDMLTNICVVDSHYCTIYKGNPTDMITYFTNEEKTLDYLNCEINDTVLRDDEVIIYLGNRICLDDSRARNIFNVLSSICKAFNDNLRNTNCNYELSQIFRGEYMGIQLTASCIGYEVLITHSCNNCMNIITYIGIFKNGIILFEENLI